MELSVINGKALSVNDAVFGREFNQDLVHQVVVAYRNAGRAGTKAQLSRSDVSGTTKSSRSRRVAAPATATTAPRSSSAVVSPSPPGRAASPRRSTRRCTAAPWP
jgi:ribosomal protein L4